MKLKPVQFPPDNPYLRILEAAQRIRQQRQAKRMERVNRERLAWAKKAERLRLVDK